MGYRERIGSARGLRPYFTFCTQSLQSVHDTPEVGQRPHHLHESGMSSTWIRPIEQRTTWQNLHHNTDGPQITELFSEVSAMEKF